MKDRSECVECAGGQCWCYDHLMEAMLEARSFAEKLARYINSTDAAAFHLMQSVAGYDFRKHSIDTTIPWKVEE